MRPNSLLRSLVLATAAAIAAQASPPRLNALPLWPDRVPGEAATLAAEGDTTKSTDRKVAGKNVIRIGNVSTPTMTVYPAPEGKNTGTAILVCPGGGYSILATDIEGTEVCAWLNSIGVTAVLLKYRVPARPGDKQHLAPLQDVQRALGLVRAHAKEWSLVSNRIGILGFSAGGHLAAALSTGYDHRIYPPVDAADEVSCRPDFALLIYPAYLTRKDDLSILAPELKITAETPPTFLVQAEDDTVHVENSLFYFLALKNAKVPAELHAYPAGGHGYGLRPTDQFVTHWPIPAEQWLRSLHVLAATQ